MFLAFLARKFLRILVKAATNAEAGMGNFPGYIPSMEALNLPCLLSSQGIQTRER
jgi:hypothetical protein